MKNKQYPNTFSVILSTIKQYKILSISTILCTIASVSTTLLPPLLLGKIVDNLVNGKNLMMSTALLYFATLAVGGILSCGQETLLEIFGQKITHSLRSKMAEKMTLLPASVISSQDPGKVASRFSADVDTVETLFSSGVISMVADACRIISIFIIIYLRNVGLALILLIILPLLIIFTRYVQKRMLKAQLDNRHAVSSISGQIPETVHNIRTIHNLAMEEYMEKRYESYLSDSYVAEEKNNFYDAIYSPIILFLNALTVGIVMILSATGNSQILRFFGMSVGTSVTIIDYISRIFTPIESLGMEIQTIQTAMAGIKRIDEFLSQPEREIYNVDDMKYCPGNIVFDHVTFGYSEKNILEDLSFSINKGEQVTFVGRTGAGKSTIFRLILGLYKPKSGSVIISKMNSYQIPDNIRRKLIGCVEQKFSLINGTIMDQITLNDPNISETQAKKAAEIVGLDQTIQSLPQGYNTICRKEILSQGEWQLLSIARAIASDPQILLLDEITADLDAETEAIVMKALKQASQGRTVLSVSHRIYESIGGRTIEIHPIEKNNVVI